MNSKKGLTLIELLVTVMIVGILAAVAIPMMNANSRKARASEAIAALGQIRTQFRLIRTEYGMYNRDLNGRTITAGAIWSRNIGVNRTELNGTYFLGIGYNLSTVNATGFIVTAIGNTAQNTAGITVTINQTGNITKMGL